MCCSCHLEGAVLRWAKLDAFIDESVEVALANVGGNFGPELGGDDRTPHRSTLKRSKRRENNDFKPRAQTIRHIRLQEARDTFRVGVCATLFCVMVDEVLDKIPTVV